MGLTEIERKRVLPDHLALLKQLLAHGYVQVGSTVEVDVYYSRSDVDFLETMECLRVRHTGSFAEITYKPATSAETHRAGDIIAKQETDVRLSGADQSGNAVALLAAIGMRELVRVEKTRTSYQRPDNPSVTISIDIVTGAGEFVETELMTTDTIGGLGLIAEIEKGLGIDAYPIEPRPYRDVVLAVTDSR